MPRPLSDPADLTPDELSLYTAQAADPLAVLAPFLADAALDRGLQHRPALLSEQACLPLLELLRGRILPDRECAAVAVQIHSLLAQRPAASMPPRPEELERELSAALGAPRGDAMLALLDPEGNLDPERLREQYDFQVTLLASLDLLQEQNGHAGITGIDSRFHPLPSFDTVTARLQTLALRMKITQGFNQLLLVPFALPLQRLIEAWRRDLLRNEQLLEDHGGPDREQPVWTADECYALTNGLGPDEDGRLVYFPARFTSHHGGRTKAQSLTAHPATGWQVLLTEGALTNLPRQGQGQTIAGRRQIEEGRMPRQYLADFPQGEAGWTPETYIAAFLTHLERTGQILDAQTASYLAASYLPASGNVPVVHWFPWTSQAFLHWRHPAYSSSHFARGPR